MAKPRQGKKVGARRPDIHPVHNARINFLEYYDEEQQKEALDYFVRQFKLSRDFLAGRRSRWYEYYQLYRSYSPYYESRPSWQSAIFVPETFKAIETIKPRILSALFDSQPVFSSSPAKPEFRESGKQWEWYLDTRQRTMGFYGTMYEIISGLLTYDASWAKVFYQNDDLYEGVMVEPRDIFDVFPDPMARSTNSKFRTRAARYIVDRDVTHTGLLRELEQSGLYSNTDKIEKGGGVDYIPQFDRLRVVGYDENVESAQGEDEDMHEVLEYWGIWIDRRNPEKPEYFDVVATIVDRKHLVRFEECPYVMPVDGEDYWYALKPFVMFKNIALPSELYGMGIPEQIRSLQHELNDRRNQVADAVQLSTSPVYQYVVNSLVDDDVITYAPGEKIKVYERDALTPLKRDMSWLNSLGEMGSLQEEIRDTTGMTDPIRGKPGPRTFKATEYVSLVEEGNTRIKLPIDLMNHTSLPALVRMMYLMEHQYTREEVFAQVMDAGQVSAFMKIDPSTLKFEGDFNIQVNSLFGQKGIVAQKRLDIARLAMEMVNNQVIPPDSVDFMKILKLIADAVDLREPIFIGKSPPAPAPEVSPAEGVPRRERTMEPPADLEEQLAQAAGLAGGAGGAAGAPAGNGAGGAGSPTTAAGTDIDRLAAELAAAAGIR